MTELEIFRSIVEALEALDRRLFELTGVRTKSVEIEVPMSAFSAVYRCWQFHRNTSYYLLKYIERPDGPTVRLSDEAQSFSWEIRMARR